MSFSLKHWFLTDNINKLFSVDLKKPGFCRVLKSAQVWFLCSLKRLKFTETLKEPDKRLQSTDQLEKLYDVIKNKTEQKIKPSAANKMLNKLLKHFADRLKLINFIFSQVRSEML